MSKKSEILDKAARLFEKYGIKICSMDFVAKNCKVSKRTLYEVFETKELFIREVLKCMIQHQFQHINKFRDKSEHVIQALSKVVQFSVNYYSRVNPLFIEEIKGHYLQVFTEVKKECRTEFLDCRGSLIEQGMKEGYFDSSFSAKICETVMEEMNLMIDHSDRIQFQELHPQEVFYNVFLPFLRGLATDKGRVEIQKYFTPIVVDNRIHGFREAVEN